MPWLDRVLDKIRGLNFSNMCVPLRVGLCHFDYQSWAGDSCYRGVYLFIGIKVLTGNWEQENV